ncbi:hypothetical protein BDY21DRAFT_396637 [Lineolata rhizophorae]|uniref:Uncharacterized protein n=1 Tax=Lineolata rhizophorae TaxID=578093 RepID=A0A6A6NU53_9PEZI|nr:hypothetical protein BDY21DRAFT_396637 [Lineolata rhizophorae]
MADQRRRYADYYSPRKYAGQGQYAHYSQYEGEHVQYYAQQQSQQQQQQQQYSTRYPQPPPATSHGYTTQPAGGYPPNHGYQASQSYHQHPTATHGYSTQPPSGAHYYEQQQRRGSYQSSHNPDPLAGPHGHHAQQSTQERKGSLAQSPEQRKYFSTRVSQPYHAPQEPASHTRADQWRPTSATADVEQPSHRRRSTRTADPGRSAPSEHDEQWDVDAESAARMYAEMEADEANARAKARAAAKKAEREDKERSKAELEYWKKCWNSSRRSPEASPYDRAVTKRTLESVEEQMDRMRLEAMGVKDERSGSKTTSSEAKRKDGKHKERGHDRRHKEEKDRKDKGMKKRGYITSGTLIPNST